MNDHMRILRILSMTDMFVVDMPMHSLRSRIGAGNDPDFPIHND